MTPGPHSAHGTRRPSLGRRLTVGSALIGSVALCGLFADLLASETPIVRVTSSGIEVLPDAHEQPREGDAVSFELRAPCPYGPGERRGAPLDPPSAAHWLGTDEQGRDVFSRLVHGARLTLVTGALVALLGAVGGAMAGAIANRRFGQSVERLAHSVDAFPAIIVVALFRAVEGRSSTISVVVGAALVQWATVARLVRTEVQRLSAEDFVLASRALGASRLHILVRHFLPHLAPGLLSSAALGLSAVVLLESTLSFLGLGPPISGASWGEMLAEGARHPDHAPLFWLPAIMLSLTVGAAYLIAEGLREMSDPVASRLRHEML